jgi:prevent-host-death family protein
MERTIGAFEARRSFGRVIQAVAGRGDHFLIERHGEPVAAVVPIEVYEQYKRARGEFFAHMRAVSERAALPPEAADVLAQEAVAAVRAQSPG